MPQSQAPLPFTSLSSFVGNVNGAGTVKDLEGVYTNHTIIASMTGPGQVYVALEGSHDNVSWISLATVTPDNSAVRVGVSGNGYGVRYVRASVTGNNGAATGSSLVTATVASI